MAIIKFTSNLKRFYPDLSTLKADCATISEAIDVIEMHHKGLKDYIVDEKGHLRKHVNIFIGKKLIQDREALKDSIETGDEVYIMQAISGG